MRLMMNECDIRVFVDSIKIDDNGCWIWQASFRKDDGYPLATGLGVGSMGAHRVSAMHWVGDVPFGYNIHHACRQKTCVNPAHLEILSTVEHRAAHADDKKGATHCNHGHEWNDANSKTYARPDGVVVRSCRACNREAQRRRVAARSPEERARRNALRRVAA